MELPALFNVNGSRIHGEESMKSKSFFWIRVHGGLWEPAREQTYGWEILFHDAPVPKVEAFKGPPLDIPPELDIEVVAGEAE